ncbi:uncharacterized protein LOC130623994 [Hydractinia symbiolongicarpus]|uniref:uncharacterized protein LOC130623994 n=1 Tax=Hydractinia symbiolongicarpus TaxID=13093 RepID=UPI00254ED82C|nr:uncharacterized protein LOC130623994 [Hydractinia symbiolongicarpus]
MDHNDLSWPGKKQRLIENPSLDNTTKKFQYDDNMSLDTLSSAAGVLRSLHDKLNERRTMNRSDEIRSEIKSLEEEIVKLSEEIKTTQNEIKQTQMRKQQNIEAKKEEEANDKACLLSVLEKECQRELKKKSEMLQKNLERKKGMELARLEKRIRDTVIQAKQSNRQVCLSCGDVASSLSTCGNCYDAFYCNEICQQNHWSVHQYFCVE